MAKILVVDDSPTEMLRFREILVKHGFEMVPDVVIMDIVMPEMNGFQATRKITREPKTAHIPVVIVSTKNQETDRVWGKRQGAKEYLTKPINEEELIKVIRSVMSVSAG